MVYFYLRQVVDILKMSGNDELFSPEMDVIKYRDSDPGLDLLGALLAVSQPAASLIWQFLNFDIDTYG